MVSRIERCEFTNNTVETIGGGLYLFAGGVVTGCVFEGNHAATGGGAYGNGFINCTFRQNTAQRGGAGPLGAEGCLFEDNTATIAGGACGESGRFVRCTFRGNSAPRGGAVASASYVEGCVFEDNAATAGTGGAIEQCTRAVASTFVRNTAAGDGGAGYLITAANCRLSGNSSGGNGGAVVNSTSLINCLLTGNTAAGSGGGAYNVRTLYGCTVVGNHAATVGGAHAGSMNNWDYNQTHRAVNSIFWQNTADSGSVEDQQLRYPVTADSLSDELLSAVNTPVTLAWNSAPLFFGPLSGGIDQTQIQSTVNSGITPPYTFPFAINTPAGYLASMTPVRTQAEKWVSVQAASASNMPSALMQFTGATAPRLFSRAQWRFSFAVDGQVGDSSSPGLYIRNVGIPGTVGGGPAVQTDWTLDVSDAVVPGAQNRQTIYIRNDSGFAGIRFRSVLEYVAPPVAYCIVQGLSVYAGEQNTGADPVLTFIAGPDGVIGTDDDDPTPAVSSPAIDSANSRMIATDESDLDGDGNTLEPLTTDLFGNTRVIDGPTPNTGAGLLAGMDRGAVEALPYQPLLAPPCRADIGRAGGVFGQDGMLDNNDFIAFIDAFFVRNPAADKGSAGGVPGSDGAFDNNDFIAFINLFFAGCQQ
ncbi:MAG: GC-type dockerin domain-anchored protein [Phycisphaerales bacterium]